MSLSAFSTISTPDSPTSTSTDLIAGKTKQSAIRVLEARVYRGPNIHAYRRVIRLKLDLGILEQFPTDLLGDFNERLLQLVPTLVEHTCSYGEHGGFVRRLNEGTWLGHVVEHIALELQNIAGIHVTYGKTRGAGERDGVYYVVYSYDEERVGLRAGWLALRLADSLLPPELRGVKGLEELCAGESVDGDFNFQKELDALIHLATRLALGPTTQSLISEAERRGIPAIRLDEQSLVQLGYGKYQQRIRASVTSHTSSGAAAVLQHAVNGEMIAIYDRDQYIPLMWTHHIPATLGGRASFNVANALAAAAIAYALQVPIPVIRQGLSTFTSSFLQNPGRLNVYDELPFRVILDYGHNPAALSRVRDLVQKLRPGYQRVISVIAGVGDRRDEDIRQLGAEAAQMSDQLIIKEDARLRGREPGETSALVQAGARSTGLDEKNISIILNEYDAVQAALTQANRGDLVIVFADEVRDVWDQITSFRKADATAVRDAGSKQP